MSEPRPVDQQVNLPAGLQIVRGADAEAFSAPEVEAWVRAALARDETLYEAATEQADLLLQGRGPVPVVTTTRGRWVVRRYRHGGWVAGPLLGDRYLRVGVGRPVQEACTSAEVRRRGIATPRVMAGAVYRHGPFYRADLITEFIAEARDLAHALFDAEHSEAERAEILRAVGALLARSAAAGIEHPDVNAKNVLLERSVGGPFPLLLDLDRCRTRPPGVACDAAPMVERLARSLRKHEERTRLWIGRSEWGILWENAGLGNRG